MSEEEKEQWLYEEYKYTSNFDFNRLDKYEEANDDICIDDLILDYTMLYEHYKKEIERLKTNWEVAQEDLSRIAKLLDLEEGCTIYDIEDRIERLNNIINELEKWLDKKEKLTFNSWNKGIHEVQRKLQELKGDDSNE